MVELTEEHLAAVRAQFAAALAREMGYDGTEVLDDLETQLDVALDGPDVRLRFVWCGREVLCAVDRPEALDGVIVTFAADVADDLTEHRGRGETLPWDR